jgi:hypothetical protein
MHRLITCRVVRSIVLRCVALYLNRTVQPSLPTLDRLTPNFSLTPWKSERSQATQLTPVRPAPLTGIRRLHPRNIVKSFLSLWKSPPKWILISLTLVVALLGYLGQHNDEVSDWFNKHNFHPNFLSLSALLFWSWFLLYLLNECWVRFVAIVDQDKWITANNLNARKVAGNLQKLAGVLSDNKGVLPEPEARQLVISFLARIVNYASLILNDPECQVRACCYRAYGESDRDACVEVWTYDAPHPGTGHRRLKFGQLLAGKVASDRKAYIADDTFSSELRPIFGQTEYRSVVGFPLIVGDDRLVGVVTIDASKPRAFSSPGIGLRIEGGSSPILAAIALTIDTIA